MHIRIYRDEGKFIAEYKGKLTDIPKDEIKKWKEIKKKRANYRHSLSQMKKEISFLNRVLGGKV